MKFSQQVIWPEYETVYSPPSFSKLRKCVDLSTFSTPICFHGLVLRCRKRLNLFIM